MGTGLGQCQPAASAPDQVFCWDITYVPTQVRGQHFYLYLFEDLFSSKIVGWQVFDCESAGLASQLLTRDICARQAITPRPVDGAFGQWRTHEGRDDAGHHAAPGSCPHTQPAGREQLNNPYVESAFRTLKYRPELPVKPFENLLAARRWVTELAHWYNHEHRHSAIGFVTPAQGHAGLSPTLLEKRALVYERARQTNPQRWSGQVRWWAHVDVVHLNPETPQIKEPHHAQKAACLNLI